MSFKNELQAAYTALSERNIVYLTPDVGKSVNAHMFRDLYQERYVNVGIAEQNAICMSAGLAIEGFTVLLSAYAVFASGRGWELIRNYICYPNLNVKIIASHGGLNVGQDGVTHQATEDLAIMRSIPNMHVLSVADPAESLSALELAANTYGPVYVRLGRADFGSFRHTQPWEMGKSETLTEGNDVAIIATGLMVKLALDAAEALKANGTNCRVINMRSIKPLDEAAIIKAAKETRLIITAEDHNIIGGLYSATCETLAKNKLNPHIVPIAVEDFFAESGDGIAVMNKYGLNSARIQSVIGQNI